MAWAAKTVRTQGDRRANCLRDYGQTIEQAF